ncbi:hypothetical protein BGX28_006933, partial [Mortierella sp. GBA30]
YLENSVNWSSLYGEDKKTVVGHKYITAGIAWDNFAQWFNKEANYDLNGKAMQQRVGRYKSKFATARAFFDRTGAGITEDDIAHGIDTVEKKKESICPLFDRMEALFGSSVTIEPQGEFNMTGRTLSFNSRVRMYTVERPQEEDAPAAVNYAEDSDYEIVPNIVDWREKDAEKDEELVEERQEEEERHVEEEEGQEEVEEEEVPHVRHRLTIADRSRAWNETRSQPGTSITTGSSSHKRRLNGPSVSPSRSSRSTDVRRGVPPTRPAASAKSPNLAMAAIERQKMDFQRELQESKAEEERERAESDLEQKRLEVIASCVKIGMTSEAIMELLGAAKKSS